MTLLIANAHFCTPGNLCHQRIPSIFLSLFQSHNPALIIRTVLSMESFAIKVPPSHRDILPKCIPNHCQLLLQARLKGELYSFVTGSIISSKVSSVVTIHPTCGIPDGLDHHSHSIYTHTLRNNAIHCVIRTKNSKKKNSFSTGGSSGDPMKQNLSPNISNLNICPSCDEM